MRIRIQKYLSEQGVCSRRHAEKLIVAGLVSVNGEVVTELGTKVDPAVDKVDVDDRVVEERRKLAYVALNKPVGIVTTCSQRGARTVMDLVKTAGRMFPVGRLDKDSSGLLLMTNDGMLAYRLTHPKFGHEKEYIVDVAFPITEGALSKLRHGLKLDGRRTQGARAWKAGGRRFRITLREGRNRQIRRMCRKIGNPVTRLKRIRVENVTLGSLEPGKWRYLSEGERKELLRRAGRGGIENCKLKIEN